MESKLTVVINALACQRRQGDNGLLIQEEANKEEAFYNRLQDPKTPASAPKAGSGVPLPDATNLGFFSDPRSLTDRPSLLNLIT